MHDYLYKHYTPIMPVDEPQVPEMEEGEMLDPQQTGQPTWEEQQEWNAEEWGEEWEMEEEELIPEEDNNSKPWIFYDDDDENPVWNDYFEVPSVRLDSRRIKYEHLQCVYEKNGEKDE